MDPVLSVEDIFIGEGDGTATVTFELSDPATAPASISYYTTNSTAIGGFDFTNVSPTPVGFAVGQQVQTVNIPIINNTSVEPTEHFFVNFINPTGLVLADPFSLVAIMDNDDTSRAPYASVSDVWVDESDGLAYFDILLDRGATQSVTVDYATSSGSASAGSDFGAVSGSVTFAAGEVAKRVAVPVLEDTTAESAETFQFDLTGISGGAGAQIADGRATGTISRSDETALSSPLVSLTDTIVSEGVVGGTIDLVLRLNGPAAQATSVEILTNENSALDAFDYSGIGPTVVVFAPGETVRTIRIPMRTDTSKEGIEHFQVQLQNPVGLTVAQPHQIISIMDNDDATQAPVASVSERYVDETDGFAFFTILLDRVSSVPITVGFETVEWTAIAGADFTPMTGSVTFNPGETSAQIGVEIIDDSAAETMELFEFNLTTITGVAGAAIGDGQATGSIARSDGTAINVPTVSVGPRSFSEGEPNGTVPITLTLNAPSAQSTSALVATSNGSAFDAFDYTAPGLVDVVFYPGETLKTVHVPLKNETNGIEAPEQFWVHLLSPSGLNISQSFVPFTIYDNDAGERAPIISVFDRHVDEKDGLVYFDIILDRSVAQPLQVAYQTRDGSAADGTDYLGRTGTVVFQPGDTVKTVAIAIFDDGLAEAAEDFFFELTDVSGIAGASVAIGAARATLGVSDGTPIAIPTISIEDIVVTEGDLALYADVILRLNGPSNQATSVEILSTDMTALGGVDYRDMAVTTVSFDPGETLKTYKVPIINDASVEPNETLAVTLQNPFGLSILNPTRTVTIKDDDLSQVVVSTQDLQQAEGDTGTVDFMFVATRSGDTSSTQTVNWSVESVGAGTNAATADDFPGALFPNGVVTFGIGETQKTITIQTGGDLTFEGDETFGVRLSNPSAGLVILNDLATATLLNDDTEVNTVTGTVGDDILVGNALPDNAHLLAGDDVFSGLGNDDTINGDAGNDTLNGNGGDDILAGGDGADLLEGSSGDDVLHGGDDADTLDGGAGSDPDLAGGNGHDLISGGGGNDTLSGDAGDDTLLGGTNNDLLSGGANHDRLFGELGADTLDGGTGDDYLAGANSTDSLMGGSGQDTLLGQGASDTLYGGSGNDSLNGGASADQLFGEGGSDTLDGAAYNDLLDGGAGNDLLLGGSGDDMLWGGSGADTLDGGSNADTLNGGDYNDSLTGGIGSDVLMGDAGVDTLLGGNSNDTLDGGGDADSLDGGSGSDLIMVASGQGGDTLTGGAGADIFDFETGFGTATITDFGTTDVIDLVDVASASGFDDLAITYGTNAVIQLGGADTITLSGVTGGLNATDFAF